MYFIQRHCSIEHRVKSPQRRSSQPDTEMLKVPGAVSIYPDTPVLQEPPVKVQADRSVAMQQL